jgi:hypothetical protein
VLALTVGWLQGKSGSTGGQINQEGTA